MMIMLKCDDDEGDDFNKGVVGGSMKLM